MDISELGIMVESLTDAVVELENITGYADVESDYEYRDELESAAAYVAECGGDIVTFLDENRIKDVRDDANNYFKIDSLDARLKADFLAVYFERLTYAELQHALRKTKINNFF